MYTVRNVITGTEFKVRNMNEARAACRRERLTAAIGNRTAWLSSLAAGCIDVFEDRSENFRLDF